MQTKQEIISIITREGFNPSDKLVQLAGDASSRIYWRSHCDDSDIILCTNQSSRAFFETTSFLKEKNIPVPIILKELPKEKITIQQDLGPFSLFDKIKEGADAGVFYKDAINILGRIHNISKSETMKHFFGELFFDEEKLNFESTHTHNYYLDKYLKLNICSDEKISLDKNLDWMNKKLQEQDFILCHRDYHSKNIMVVGKDEKLILIDYQDMRMGLPQYDLVSLVEDCYVDLDIALKEELKDYYWEKYLKDKKSQTREEFEYFYKLSLIQRYYKAIGSFAYMATEKKNNSYLQYIPSCLNNILKTISFFPELEFLKRFLEERCLES